MQYPKQHPTYKHLIAAELSEDRCGNLLCNFLDDDLDKMELGTGNNSHLFAQNDDEKTNFYDAAIAIHYRGETVTARLLKPSGNKKELRMIAQGYNRNVWLPDYFFDLFLSEAEYYGYDVPA